MTFRPFVVCIVALLALAPSLHLARANSATISATADSLDRLEVWLDRHGRKGEYLTTSLRKELENHLESVAKVASGKGTKAVPARIALLRVAGWGLDRPNAAKVSIPIQEVAQRTLEKRLQPGRGRTISDWILSDVMAFPERYETIIRLVAVRALGTQASLRKFGSKETDHILVAIMSAASDEEAIVRQAAHDVLCLRNESFVSDYFLGALERGQITPELFSRHLQTLTEMSPDAHESWWELRSSRLYAYVVKRLESPDWRESSRALSLAPLFSMNRITPYLIQGLGLWTRRETPGRRRVLHEFGVALGTISGKNFGDRPEVWARWWQSATEGGKQPPAPKQQTQATFFGLRPFSDRVLFVIDRSGSMRDLFEGRRSRFQEAVERLIYTLRDLGPETEFGVVLFSSDGRSFSDKLEVADDETLERLKAWALDMGPNGGTDLHSGIRAGFPGLETGTLKPSEIPYDTVIVLCDGQTESPKWVAPWLAKYNQAARLIFHCVNIGGKPGGVLEALATGTGGSFIVSE